MRCRCGANLAHVNRRGEPVLRNHGLVLKAEGVAAICPKCHADVPIAGDMAKALSNRILLVFKSPNSQQP